jgi:ABC-type phosphate transport system substrate-binding protein
MRAALLMMFALSLPGATAHAEEGLALIINKSNSVESMSTAQVRKMILGEQSQWSSGKRVSVALLSSGNAEREAVLRVICGMSETEFGQHLLHANFNGETSAPKALASDAAVRSTVMAVPGAIGFIRASEVNDSVKLVRLDGALPGEPGYKLKVK